MNEKIYKIFKVKFIYYMIFSAVFFNLWIVTIKKIDIIFI